MFLKPKIYLTVGKCSLCSCMSEEHLMGPYMSFLSRFLLELKRLHHLRLLEHTVMQTWKPMSLLRNIVGIMGKTADSWLTVTSDHIIVSVTLDIMTEFVIPSE